MKKIVLFIFLFFSFPAYALADETTAVAGANSQSNVSNVSAGTSAATSSGTANVNVDARNQSVTEGSKWGFIPPTKQDGSIITPPQPTVWLGADKVPVYYRGQGFNHVWIEPAYLRDGLTVEEMKRLSTASSWWASMGWGKRAIRDELSLTRDDLSANGGRLWILPDFPDPRIHTLKKLGEYDADGPPRCSIDKLVGEGGLKLAERGAKYIMVLATSKFYTEGNVRALGGAGVLGKMVGPDSRPDEMIAGGAAGFGIGSARAWVDRAPKIKIIAWYDITPAPKITIPGPWPEKEVVPPPPPRAEAAPPPPPPSAAPKPSCAECETRARELEQEKDAIQQQFDELVARKPKEAPPLDACPVSIMYPFTHWDLSKKDRTGYDYNLERVKVPQMAQYIINSWARIEKVGEFVFVGHADSRPPDIKATGANTVPDVINDPLAFQRANMTRALVLDELRKRGFGPEKIRKIKSVSSGKRWRLIDQARNEKEHQANRQVYLVVIIPGLHGYASK